MYVKINKKQERFYNMDYLVGSIEEFKFWTDPKLYDSFTNNIDMNSFWKMCVKKYPNNIAIENEEYKLTYAELDIKASELRSAIIEEGCINMSEEKVNRCRNKRA